jgi:hypothetical protein
VVGDGLAPEFSPYRGVLWIASLVRRGGEDWVAKGVVGRGVSPPTLLVFVILSCSFFVRSMMVPVIII